MNGNLRSVLPLLALAALAACRGAAQPAGYTLLTPHQLQHAIADREPLVIVDVREPAEFAAGHIPGARLIPYGEAHARVLRELKPNDRIVFVCHTGPMGDELSRLLAANGYRHVANLAGGIAAWTGPTVKGG